MTEDQPHKPPHSFGSDFKKFFFRGLAILLPTVLTIWVLAFAYQFVNDNIAGPINDGVRAAVIRFSDWPEPTRDDFLNVYDDLPSSRREAWENRLFELRTELDLPVLPPVIETEKRLEWMQRQPDIVFDARLHAFEARWNSIQLGRFTVLNLIGIVLAIVLIYIAGVLVTSFIGRRLYREGEKLIARVPLIRSVYPAVKQVTDFFFGDDSETKVNFNRVVAVQYPRKGLWSVGLVTGDTMQFIEQAAGQPCLTVFVPSSPTPFTGYVITVPKADTIDLPISVEEALKFAVSGGVVIPQNQVIHRDADQLTLPNTTDRRRTGQRPKPVPADGPGDAPA
jgi:uncharacterized membrane protein